MINIDIDSSTEQVEPRYRLAYGKVKPFDLRHDPVPISLEEWQTIHEWEPCKWRNNDPRRVIPQLIHGRIHAPPFPTGSATKHPYVMSAAQVLDFLGIAEATWIHLQIAESALRELLGEPKKANGRKRWLIYPRDNDNSLRASLATKYRVPARREFEMRNHFFWRFQACPTEVSTVEAP